MAERTCLNCMYSVCDPCLWLRWLRAGESIVAQCANHPQWPGRLHDVPGVPCRNYRPKPTAPQGEGVRMIALGGGGYAYVDAADYEWLSRWHWYDHEGYAARPEKGRTILMHRQIMQPPKGMIVDHADGNRANNCRCNLRVCTRADNSHNQRKHACSASAFKGVGYHKETRKWYPRCSYKGEYYRHGYFNTDVEAARAYDELAVAWFGEFARLNFPREWPPERRAQVYAQNQPQREQADKAKRKRKTAKSRRDRGKVERKKVKTKGGKPRRARGTRSDTT